MQEQNLTAFSAGILSSAFYYVYTTMQIPVGMLFDRYNTRTLLSFNAFLCALGCFLFASADNFWVLFLGRLIIGGGSSFAFVGLARILQHYYPLKHYAFLIGFAETLGFTVTVLGMMGMGILMSHMSWRYVLIGSGIIGILIATLCWALIPNNKPVIDHHQYKKHLLFMLKNKLVWINGLFVGLEFSVITVFAALWAVPFLQLKFECTIETASILTSMILLGAGLSCPVYGWLSMHLSKRKPLIHFSCLSTAILLILLLFLPLHNLLIAGLLLFSIGLLCGAYMLAFSIANELTPPESLSACTGFTNTLGMLTAPLLQPLIGYLLDKATGTIGTPTLAHYQWVLLIIPAALISASIFSQFLPEKER
jgi:MFS family permease